jgi:hypothetical protein
VVADEPSDQTVRHVSNDESKMQPRTTLENLRHHFTDAYSAMQVRLPESPDEFNERE